MQFSFVLSLFSVIALLTLGVSSSPFPRSDTISRRTTPPFFPATPASCPICESDYGSIQNCAEAAPVLANFSMIIFNPGAFVDIIQCACTETFQSVFPQCVDCFQATNQTDVLDTSDLPSVIAGMKNICGLASTLLGNVSVANGEVTPSPTTAPAAATTESNSAVSMSMGVSMSVLLMCIGLIVGL